MHSTRCSTVLGVAACKGLRPSPCWADFVTTGTGGAVLCPVTLQAQRCWNCFGAICCEKYSKHQVTEFPFTALFWGVAALSQPPGREVAGVLPPPAVPCHPALRGSCSHLCEVKPSSPKAGKSEINFLFTAVLITLICTLLRQLRTGGFLHVGKGRWESRGSSAAAAHGSATPPLEPAARRLRPPPKPPLCKHRENTSYLMREENKYLFKHLLY